MSVLIRGMEMPKENDYTIAIVYGDGVVTEYHDDYWIRGADGEKQLGIAVPVPPHGDLIDRTELWVEINKICDRRDAGIITDLTCLQQILSAIRHALTIITAEEKRNDKQGSV